MNLKPYTHVIIMAAVFIGALSLYGAWYARVGEESANAVSIQSQIQAKQQTAARAQEAKTQLNHALADRAAITGYFVNTNDVVPFLETLQSTGTKFGSKVAVESVSSQPAKPHTLLQLSVSITGSFDGVERTLGAIEYEPYDTTITSVTLDTPGGTKGAPQWTAAVTMNVGTIDATKSSTTTATSTTP